MNSREALGKLAKILRLEKTLMKLDVKTTGVAKYILGNSRKFTQRMVGEQNVESTFQNLISKN